MKIFTSQQIKEIDKFTIENEPIASIDLMERAAHACSQWFVKRYEKTIPVRIFAGPGNNGGDALAIARQLIEQGFSDVKTYVVRFTQKFSDDFNTNYIRLINIDKQNVLDITEEVIFPAFSGNEIILDGIFGSGLNRPAEGFVADVIKQMNYSHCEIVSIDIPSGLFSEDNTDNDFETIIRATFTLSLQFPKFSFFLPETNAFVGRWQVLPIGLHQDFINRTDTGFGYIDADFIRTKHKNRKRFSHKGTYGHALVIAGSYGKIGASILTSKAALRAGVGLLTTHIPRCGYEIVQTALPEAMLSIDENDQIFTRIIDADNYSTVAIGPGIGKEKATADALHEFISQADKPVVLDADAINIIGMYKEWLLKVPENSIFTPHPKEFERLAGESDSDMERLKKQIEFSKKYHQVVVLKTAYTSITTPDGYCYFNTTGNPGMATAGSGDVLTGIIVALLAQQYSPADAAMIAVYVHGLAGDIAASAMGYEAVIASDIIENLGKAFKSIHNY